MEHLSLPHPTTHSQADLFSRLPKVELHRHLEGSLRISTMLEIARSHGLTLPAAPRLSQMVQVQSGEPLTSTNFLSKFQILRLFYRSPDVIRRITREAILDANADGVQYLELRFTPVALSRAEGFPLSDVMDWVCEAARDAQAETGLVTRLIASVNRHENPTLAEKVAGLAVDRMSQGVCGLDLAGNEADFTAIPFLGILREARQNGLKVTVHAGEWGGAENVREAIEKVEADRIAHGVRVLEDPRVTALARERGVPFEVCITSNYQSGVVHSLSEHPLLPMLNAGLVVTINTDDPSISQVTLTDEYRTAVDGLGLPLEALKERILAAARCSFLAEAEKKVILNQIEGKLGEITLAD